MSIMEVVGLTRGEAQEFVAVYRGYSPTIGAPATRVATKLATLIAAELEASRPIEPGDVVRIPFAPTHEFEVRCVEDDEAWVLDVKSGGRLTVKLACIERVQP